MKQRVNKRILLATNGYFDLAATQNCRGAQCLISCDLTSAIRSIRRVHFNCCLKTYSAIFVKIPIGKEKQMGSLLKKLKGKIVLPRWLGNEVLKVPR